MPCDPTLAPRLRNPSLLANNIDLSRQTGGGGHHSFSRFGVFLRRGPIRCPFTGLHPTVQNNCPEQKKHTVAQLFFFPKNKIPHRIASRPESLTEALANGTVRLSKRKTVRRPQRLYNQDVSYGRVERGAVLTGFKRTARHRTAPDDFTSPQPSGRGETFMQVLAVLFTFRVKMKSWSALRNNERSESGASAFLPVGLPPGWG